MRKKGAQLELVMPRTDVASQFKGTSVPQTTIDLFCGAGGITEGFREAGYKCLYANDRMPEAVEPFLFNHPEVWAEAEDIENVDPASIRKRLQLEKRALDVLVGGPPCQGFSINAPERFLSDKRNKLFKDYVRFLEEFEPKAFLFENVPGLLSLGDGKVFRQIVREFEEHGYCVTPKILLAAHYGVPQERWRLIIMGSRTGAIRPPEPTHYASCRANFRSGATMTYQLDAADRYRFSRRSPWEKQSAICRHSGWARARRCQAGETKHRTYEIRQAGWVLAGYTAPTTSEGHAAGEEVRPHQTVRTVAQRWTCGHGYDQVRSSLGRGFSSRSGTIPHGARGGAFSVFPGRLPICRTAGVSVRTGRECGSGAVGESDCVADSCTPGRKGC